MRPMPHLLPTLALASLTVPSAHAGSLAADVAALVRSAKLPGAEIAVSIRDVATGESMVGIREDLPLIPASNMKLLTTGAALAGLGPEFRFRTLMALDRGDRVRLIVRGDGDPAFGDPELLATTMRRMPDGSVETGLDVETLLAAWADAVAETGVDRIDELVVYLALGRTLCELRLPELVPGRPACRLDDVCHRGRNSSSCVHCETVATTFGQSDGEDEVGRDRVGHMEKVPSR